MTILLLIFNELQMNRGVNSGGFTMKIPYFIENIYFAVGVGLRRIRCGIPVTNGRHGVRFIPRKKNRVLRGKSVIETWRDEPEASMRTGQIRMGMRT
jgi:hypothetical protein